MLGRTSRRTRPAPRTQFLTASLALLVLTALIFSAPILVAAKSRADDSRANSVAAATKQTPVLAGVPITDLTEQQAILHALDRLGYGLRPGDVARV